MKTSKTKIILIITVAVFALLLIADVLLLNFLRSESNTVGNLRRTFLEEYSQNYSSLNTERKLAEATVKEIFISRMFLPENEIVEFISYLEALGINNGVVVVTKAVDVSGLDDAASRVSGKIIYGDLSVVLEISGDWAGVIKFIKLVENSPYYSQINSLKLSRNAEDPADPWKAIFSLKIAVKSI
ncbi:MAG TPA: hypothetical protein P5328_00475 [Candidatus Paceibacterota bacterium]|nr:hypothetical protein [Candidatus Paceibacterota bacterium]HRZ34200.1 hypothetical protein [Candidatus Paceibacterota bacterium]